MMRQIAFNWLKNKIESADASPWTRAALVAASLFVSIATLRYIEDRIVLERALRKTIISTR